MNTQKCPESAQDWHKHDEINHLNRLICNQPTNRSELNTCTQPDRLEFNTVKKKKTTNRQAKRDDESKKEKKLYHFYFT